mmetsp:Transcript_96944/g.256033  ORF Transcript_96944/g.256033 Transcript_96944/m.256033 type:complete len:259 (+) Transcript_96944:93-869(+)
MDLVRGLQPCGRRLVGRHRLRGPWRSWRGTDRRFHFRAVPGRVLASKERLHRRDWHRPRGAVDVSDESAGRSGLLAEPRPDAEGPHERLLLLRRRAGLQRRGARAEGGAAHDDGVGRRGQARPLRQGPLPARRRGGLRRVWSRGWRRRRRRRRFVAGRGAHGLRHLGRDCRWGLRVRPAVPGVGGGRARVHAEGLPLLHMGKPADDFSDTVLPDTDAVHGGRAFRREGLHRVRRHAGPHGRLRLLSPPLLGLVRPVHV